MTDDNSTDDTAGGKPSVSGDRGDSFGRADSGDDSAEAVRTPDGSRSGRSDDADSVPLSDLAGRVAERRARSRVIDQRNGTNKLFESVEIGELNRNDMWTSLVEGGDDVETGGVDVRAETTPVDDGEGVTDHIVPKSEFCQRCEHFTAPSELAYHHERTTIVGFEDSDHFRMRNCPIVEKDD